MKMCKRYIIIIDTLWVKA